MVIVLAMTRALVRFFFPDGRTTLAIAFHSLATLHRTGDRHHTVITVSEAIPDQRADHDAKGPA